MSSVNEIERVLRQVADQVEVPPLDEAGLHRQVRRQRGRRATSGVLAAGVTAAAVVVGVWLAGADPWTRPATQQAPATTGPAGDSAPSAPVYLTVGDRLAALTPDGKLHRLRVRVEEVLGATGDGVMAVDRESHLVRFRAVRSEGEWRFDRVDPPTTEAVQGAAVSRAPSRAAWLSLEDEVVTYDLQAGAVVARVRVPQSTSLQAVASGVLVHDGTTLRLIRDDGASVDLSVDQNPWSADVAGGLVAVADGAEGASTTVYDVSDGSAQVLDRVRGSGVLAPDGSGLLSLLPGERDGAALVWTPDGERPVTGLEGVAVEVAWADPGTAVVLVRVGAGGARTDVYTCSLSDAACELALRGGQEEIGLRR